MLKKRGYFFTLDAALGLFTLIIGIVLITSKYIEAPAQTQVAFLSDDLLNFISKNKIKDLNNPYAGIGGELWNNGTITDSENTLLQQIGEFYATKKLETAEQFIQSISFGVVPEQYRYEIWIDDVIVYPNELSIEHNNSKNSTNLLLTSKTITFGIINQTTSDIWGPYKAEVFVWES